jgi:cytosine/adenosine deaminase-related metal-dependent hydrolase
MSTIDPIKIEGLRDFQRALKQMDGESQKQLRIALNKAADLVAADASAKVPRRSGRAAHTVRAQSSQTEARVLGGTKKISYYPWLDFGGRIGRNKSVHREFVKRGRYIYPAYVRQYSDVMAALTDALVELAQDAGLEVH